MSFLFEHKFFELISRENPRRSFSLFLVLIVILFFTDCLRIKERTILKPSSGKWVEKTLGRMSAEEKIGQMIVCSFSGYFMNEESEEFRRIWRLVKEFKIGGLILFGGNVFETAFLINSFQEMAKIPLLIASDLEFGLGTQVEGATQFPPLMAIGAIGKEEEAYLMGKATALEARAIGIHLAFAPVVDVNINPENPIINIRSFGEQPEEVTRLGVAFIRGCSDYGLLTTAKHFPGHGDTNLDSHLELPVIEGDRERLEKVELYPFKKAIEAGVQVVMSSHLWVPALEPTPGLPATLSSRIMTDLLRRELGFKGLIVTDAMDMGGITNLFEPEEAALRAVEAGVDMILLPPSPERVIRRLLAALEEGRISEARINSSVRRILEVKANLGLDMKKVIDSRNLSKMIGKKEHLRLASRMFEDSLTLVKNEGGLIPLSAHAQKLAVLSLSSDRGGYEAGKTLAEEIMKRSPGAFTFFADFDTAQEFFTEALLNLEGCDAVVVGLFSLRKARKGSIDLIEEHAELVKRIISLGKPVIGVSFGSPYFLKHFPEIPCYLCAYAWSSQAQEKVAAALFGEIELKGKLPVTIPGLFPRGHGLVLPAKKEKKRVR